jgi:signal peptidase I
MIRIPSSQTAALVQSALAHGGTLWMTIEGDSMKPFLQRGDRILIQSRSVASLRSGDLVTFTDGATVCTHRLLGKNSTGDRTLLVTKGDLCGRWDRPVPAESILGKGIAVLKGRRMIGLDGIQGRALNLVLLFFSLLMGWVLWLKWKMLS